MDYVDDDTDDHDGSGHGYPAAADPVLIALELCKLANNKTVAAAIKKLRRLDRQFADATAKLADVERQARELVAKAESDVKAIRDEAQRRLEAAEAAEQELETREHRIAALEAAWRMLGEPQDVLSGFRSPEFSPLQKARMAHGQPPGRAPDPFGLSHDADEPAAAIDALITRDVGDERSDHLGNAFAPSTLTRSTEHKRGVA
jgi:hypothetical protein